MAANTPEDNSFSILTERLEALENARSTARAILIDVDPVSALHSKKDPHWGTPPDWVERMRAALGGRIALDPFSSEIANRVVRAERYFTPEDDGFEQLWDADTVGENPPGLKVALAWRKTLDEHAAGRARQVAWIGFSIEQLPLLSDPLEPEDLVARDAYLEGRLLDPGALIACPADFSICFPRKRISFVREDGSTGSPAHGNYACGIGVDRELWDAVMSPMGRVFHGPLTLASRPSTKLERILG